MAGRIRSSSQIWMFLAVVCLWLASHTPFCCHVQATTPEGDDSDRTCLSSDAENCQAEPNGTHDEEGTIRNDVEDDPEEDTTVTIELGEELMNRIQSALKEAGVFMTSDREKIEQIAMEEVHKYYAEIEMERDATTTTSTQDEQRQKWLQERLQGIKSSEASSGQKPDFPYTLTPPPPPIMESTEITLGGKDSNATAYQRQHTRKYSLDFVQDWNPPGGGRYAEYASGTSPYFVSDNLKQQSDEIARLRRPYIQTAMQYAWDGYRNYAWGADEIRPQSKKGSNHFGGIAVTLVDALDTLWLMNMTDEFATARDYVRDSLTHDQDRKVSVFETTIRSLGGLLSAYDWSRDHVFLEEAMDLARRLMKAFVHPVTGTTILPFGEVNLQSGSCNMIPWAGGNAILSEFGTLQIEFRYLDQVVQTSETAEFRDKVEQIFEVLHAMSPANGLFPYYMKTDTDAVSTKSKKLTKSTVLRSTSAARVTTTETTTSTKSLPVPYFNNDHITFGAMADSFYEYMLKIWLQGGKTEPMYRNMYDKAMQGMHEELLHVSTPSGLTYLADKVGGAGKKRGKKFIKHKMDHLVCFVGGMLALGAYTDPLGLDSDRAQRDLQTAKALTYTCYQMYARMNTGISPEYVEFVAGEDFRIGSVAPHYLLRPEAVESFYILSVLTGDPIYREWGWEVFQSIEKYCKTHAAYGSLGNVQDMGLPPRDDMESFFLAETLKYLYLLFDPDSEIDILNKHVFNTEAHPLRMFSAMVEEERQSREAQ